jgi:predicted ATPase
MWTIELDPLFKWQVFLFDQVKYLTEMIHLKEITWRTGRPAANLGYPFNLPVIQSLENLELKSQVTFFVGENGSGKSTLLEALACAIGSITVGSESVRTDQTLSHVRKLADLFRLSWQKRTHRGFFLRAEDFFGYTRSMTTIRRELEQNLADVERTYRGKSTAAVYARLPYEGELAALQQQYGAGLDTRSHGESFLALFQSRFVPDGLYLLDEPEAPLSPLRQLAFIAALKEMVNQQAQFIIATHSPLLLAFPGATILSFDGPKLRSVPYAELENVQLVKDFLNNPEAYLKHL